MVGVTGNGWKLEGIARPRIFCHSDKIMPFLLILGHFWCSVVTSATVSGNLKNFEKNPPKIPKIPKNTKNLKKTEK